jgi:GT2 family glycosyltransferase
MDRTARDRPFLSVLLRTQGTRMANLVEALTCLAAQDDSDFEVILLVHSPSPDTRLIVGELVEQHAAEFSSRVCVVAVQGGGRSRPLNVGLERARGSYIAFLDDDDLVTADWVSTFRQGSADAPGRIVRCIAADQAISRLEEGTQEPNYVACGRLEMSRPATFDILEHFSANRTPNCSFAVPADPLRSFNVRFDEALPVMEDWQFLMRVAMLCGVFDTQKVTSIYHRWQGGESTLESVPRQTWDDTHARILAEFDQTQLLLPPGSASRIASLVRRAAVRDDVIRGLEASLAETQAYLDHVIASKDDLIGGLEAGVAEYRAYVETIIADRDELVGSLRSSLRSLEDELASARHHHALTRPTVTVIVVNGNGEELLGDCLGSLQALSYPHGRYKVVLVDNGSSDQSVGAIRRDFPDVILIEAGRHLGSAAANNLAIAASRSDYVALLDHDAVAPPDWLDELVAVAETDPSIGVVNSRIWLPHDRVVLSATVSRTFVPGSHDPRRLGAIVGVEAGVNGHAVEVEFARGAFGLEVNQHGAFRWITDLAEIRVPLVDPAASKVTIRLLPAPFPGGVQPTIRFRIGDRLVAEVTVPDSDPIDLALGFESDGTTPVDGEPFSDADRGQFSVIEDVPALSGAACLLRRNALEQTGSFDESLFMGYEDADLSRRLRESGWSIVTAARSIVRHQHRATGVGWSPRSCYDAERNRLLLLMKNDELPLAVREWARYTARLVRPGETANNRRRLLLVQRSLLRQLPSVVSARWRARRMRSGRQADTRIQA